MTPASRQRAMQALRLLAAPLLLGGVVWLAGPQALWAAVQVADARWLLAGLLCAAAGSATAALRWRELARWLGHRVSARWAVAVYFRGIAINALLPGAVVGGDLFRVWQLHRHGCPRSAAGASVALDRLSGLWMLFAVSAMALYGGLGSPELSQLRRLLHVPAAWPSGVVATLLLGGVLLLPLVALLTLSTVGGRGARPGSRRAAAVDLLRRPAGLRQYLWQAFASLLVQGLSVGAMVCAAQAFGVALPGWLIAFTTAPILLLASLPVSFGGWGTREFATVTGWAAFGVAPPLAVAAAAAFGAYSLLQAVLGLLPTPPAEVSAPGLGSTGDTHGPS